MDARPQRPVRTLRVLNDENCPPAALSKTIHQRNKSSPALTTLSQMKGIAAKRNAFADVSNIAAKRASKDDSNVGSKLATKGAQPLHESKSAAFLRPAQRPYSVSNIKNLLTLGNSESVAKVPLNDTTNTTTQQTRLPRKALTKRNTTIFKDLTLEVVQEDEVVPREVPQETANKTEVPSLPLLPEVNLTELDSNLQLPPPLSSDNVDPMKLSQPSDISLPEINEVRLDTQHMSSEIELEDQVRGFDDRHVEQFQYVQPADELASKTQYVDAVAQLPQPIDTTTVRKSQPMSDRDEYIPQSLQHLYQPPTEPEEYWEEEYDESCEPDGYVTARSFRSQGDDTTGGANAALVPRFNQKVLNEIAAANDLVEATRTPEDIEDESFDTSMVAEYGDEIFGYMKEMEQRMLPRSNYMDYQHEIQWSMRAVLMDWLVQVHHRFNLLPETLFLCVNYIDRFLSVKVVSLGKLQLVGATAIFIAAKYEEINCPSVQEIVYMVDGGYSVDEILKAERFMLTMLQFELGFPGPMSFLRRISKADDYDLETRTLAKYFLEVTLMDERFIGSVPSFLAAASHCIAREMLRKGHWTQHHVHYSGYTWSQLRPVVQLLLECCEDPRKHHQAVFNKYCDKRYKRAAAFVETELQRGFVLPDAMATKPFLQNPYQVYQYAIQKNYA
ncbi:B-type cyclin [Lithohypha guttulata]|uniref:B-type cyclin n=1 Tax=Lithohypha guttulata TaxID=1690604 RepID=A0AAN7SYW9_9EURO|nr:B-type cyclin [Lithohypha guttulata]